MTRSDCFDSPEIFLTADICGFVLGLCGCWPPKKTGFFQLSKGFQHLNSPNGRVFSVNFRYRKRQVSDFAQKPRFCLKSPLCLCCRVNCSFYFKIGACRHGDRCSRIHNKPTFSQTCLLQNLYVNPQNSAKSADGSHCKFLPSF